MIQNITTILVSFIFMLILSGLVIVAVLYYLIKVKKVMASTEKLNYDNFDKRRTEEYVKFEDVIADNSGKGMKGAGMVVINKHVFVAAIEVFGYNFATASEEEKKRTMVGSVNFFRNVKAPIQMRQHVKAVDMSDTIHEHRDILKRLTLELMELDGEYEQLKQMGEDYIDDVEKLESINEQMSTLQNEIISKRYMRDEAAMLIAYLENMSDANNQAKRENHIIFSYVYNPNEHTVELTKEEIYLEAMRELSSMASIYGDGMESCGCTYRVMSGEDLLDLVRHHYHPKSADETKLRDIYNSSYNTLYVTSDSLIEMEIEKIGEEKYKEIRERIALEDEERVQSMLMESKRYAQRIVEEAEKEAKKRMMKNAS